MRKLKRRTPAAPTKAAAEAPEDRPLTDEDFKLDELPAAPALRWVEVECPYCGESFDVRVDPGEEGQSLIQDCQVCCKAVAIAVAVEDGDIAASASRA